MTPAWSSVRFGILPLEGFDLAALAGFTDALRLADKAAGGACDRQILAPDMTPIRAGSGIAIQPDIAVPDTPQIDYLVVVGGVSAVGGPIPDGIRRLICSAAEQACPVIALCSGVFTLAEAGLLDGFECSVRTALHPEFRDRFPRAIPLPDSFVIQAGRLTCAEGRDIGDLVAHVASTHRAASARLRAQDPLVVAAMLWMGRHLEAAQTIEDLSRDMRTGRRKLERHFRADIGQSPQAAYLSLRLAKAKRLLRTTNESISEVALSCGFCDASHLVRLMKGKMGMTPAQIRKAPDDGDDGSSVP